MAFLAFPSPAGADWPHLFTAEVHSSPMLADINADQVCEVIVLTKDGMLHVLRPDDTQLPGWPIQIGPASSIADGQNWVSGSAAVADLDGNGQLWILQASFDGKLHALNADGQERLGFPILMGTYSTDTPTVADLDGDGQPEILCRYNPNALGVWSAQGQMPPGWPKSIANAPGGAIDVWSCPAVTDLDGDTDLEIVAGDYSGFCHAWHHDGAVVSGWPVDLNPDHSYPGWVLSSPAAVDCESDGRYEIVIGSDDDRLFVLRGDGSAVSGWPKLLPFGFRSSPAIADLATGMPYLQPEIVIGHRSNSGDLRLYAFHLDGAPLDGWPIIQPAPTGGYTFGWLSTVLTDLDGDGFSEVVAVKERRSANPSQSEVWGFTPQGQVLPGFPIPLQGLAYAMPSIGDFDGDGLAEILIGDLSHRLYKLDLAQALNPLLEDGDWRQLQHDLGHAGEYPWWDPGTGVEGAPGGGSLYAAVPNPFRTQCVLRGGTTPGRSARWMIYDTGGRALRALRSPTGEAVWDGATAGGWISAPGVYFARSSSGAVLRLVKNP